MFASRVVPRAARVAAPRMSITASRTFADAKAAANSRPPIPLYGLDGTYASALYTAAAKSSSLDTVAKAMDSLVQTFKRDTKLQNMISSPTLSAEDKQQIVQELQKSTNVQDKDNTLKNFFHTLAENNRLGVLDGVAEKFAQLISASRGEVEMTITSATPLDSKIVKQLETAVSKSQYVGQGKKLKVVPKVNPEIKGGLIVEIGDRTIDLSASGKMARMNKLLQDTL
ncbi:hypothetical protein AMS68_002793 [Peltaster fructicola]|uniref:ATP synthase subunit 5, mitochondrial n=1 Tax=Peltaster fructicola TaxID=286661 RepID=A0A6H0XRG1_9PEZI|nr:hypothetical protein AMS68_002793 [Peltaster fructicola]